MSANPGIAASSPVPTLLGLPVRARRETLAAVGLAATYLALTMSRDLSFYDSAELALAAVQPGLSHPIGQPLHTLLGYVLTRLPFVPALLALNLLSALPAALSIVPVVSLAEGLAGEPEGNTPEGVVARAAAPAVAVLAALHAAAWEPATRVEVYTLSTLFGLWACARVSAGLASGARLRAWLAAGVALGLCASANAFVAVIAAAALLPALLVALLRRRLAPGGFAAVVAGGLAGLAPYAYVPLVARRPDAARWFVWGLPAGGHALVHYFTGADYAENTGITAAVWARHVGAWLAWSAQNALLPVLAAGVLGHALWGRGRGGRGLAALSLALTVALVNANVIWFLDNPDYLGYLAAPLGLCAAGAGALAIRGARASAPRARGYTLAGILCLLAAAAVAPPAPWARTRWRDRAARAMAAGALDEAPRGAVMLVASDHWVFPLLYLQEAEGRRPDVVVLAYGLAHSSWYWEHVFRLHPDLARVALRGPGGRAGRVRRLLAANAGRAVQFERGAIAAELGLPVCSVGWLLSSEGCGEAGAASASGAAGAAGEAGATTGAVERALADVGAGSPATDGVLAAVAFDRGEALWRLGRGAEALRALNAGVPAWLRPAGVTSANEAALFAVRPLRGPAVTFREFAPLGEPARNLFLAAQLLAAAGDRAGALADLRTAAALGLPEALGP